MSQSYHCRPSVLLGIEDDIQSFYLDRACWLYGTKIEEELNRATKDAKSETAAQSKAMGVLNYRLNRNVKGDTSKSTAGRFKDPAMM